ncbi:hypothetical protein [Flavobacterium johnsoniae]|jgi:hypothetical protein|uniref:Uncharacterized protein n=1 Tax=Flavobacterium johnsoniae (strain ATCC 17061 / DSM 2064 / JCM 8514 / BCRC 14874 / CCUG 350202 / NBRC 14942 / NCIMB 11054 / UW101) TaxID=376686 RepID=A5FKK4_FLAJ1|nr:hypothetical protein [Flavobacterium johnsoniae]ABQ04262.1 hypothetical protein Fjoh_1230 [Flavobacterium johnsoniae UW101]OXG02510.1 hypothetical protein B0A63_02300 [Flavobacterium johnsoniae UW101]WQG83945.1 hypothetical protein SR927_12635 [Flavobacterium johnsoniae UW101]SHK17217.1 hypothetical protein SAMN05444146_0651 [Flavobacterium johnsoniae]
MGFSFNTFFGYENQINELKDQVLIYGFAGIIFGILGLLFIAVLLRKIGLNTINSFFVNPLMLALGLTLLVSILPTIILYVVALDISGVKIVYSWITIFIGMVLYVMFNLETIKSFFKEFGKMTEQQEFRNRKR